MQTVQFMNLLEMPTARLEEEIAKALDENPALEIDYDSGSNEIAEEHYTPDFDDENSAEEEQIKEGTSTELFEEYLNSEEYEDGYDFSNINASKDDQVREYVVVHDTTLQELLMTQLGLQNTTEKERLIAEYIIGNLDGSGYLSPDNRAYANELRLAYNLVVSPEEIENVIENFIQEMEPAGIGARNLQECFLLQLKRVAPSPSVLLATEIVRDHFQAFSRKHYDKIQLLLNINENQLKEALQEIHKLDPSPAFSMDGTEQASTYIIPDFIITVEGGRLVLNLNSQFIPKLKINQDFKNQYYYLETERNAKLRAEAEKFIKENVDHAQQFINTLSQRELTMYNTMYVIMQKQKDYFLSGNDMDLKPMVLKDIADVVGIDISTVSRVSNNKYVQMPFGVIPVKHLFSESIDNVSSKKIKKIITDFIEEEDPSEPFTDEQIRAYLEEQGHSVARRTIAKYRDQLGIPVARLRRKV